MRGSRPWAAEDDQRLRELAGSGITVPNMTKQLDRSDAAIRTLASVLKIRVARAGYIKGLKAKK